MAPDAASKAGLASPLARFQLYREFDGAQPTGNPAALQLAGKYAAGHVPTPGKRTEADQALLDLADNSLANYRQLFPRLVFDRALESLWELVRGMNKFVDEARPWELAKRGEDERLATVLYILLECMRRVAEHLWPVMPGAAEKMLLQLGVDPADLQGGPDLVADLFGVLKPGTPLAPSSNLFPRVDLEAQATAPAAHPKGAGRHPVGAGSKAAGAQPGPAAQAAAAQPAGSAQPSSGNAQPSAGKKKEGREKALAAPGEASFEDFKKLDLRVGTVLAAEKHPDADKLLCLSVDLGEEAPRRIVAGLAEHFQPEALVGRQVVVVANLAPRTIRGKESRGMVLAVHGPGGLSLATSSASVPPGSRVS